MVGEGVAYNHSTKSKHLYFVVEKFPIKNRMKLKVMKIDVHFISPASIHLCFCLFTLHTELH